VVPRSPRAGATGSARTRGAPTPTADEPHHPYRPGTCGACDQASTYPPHGAERPHVIKLRRSLSARRAGASRRPARQSSRKMLHDQRLLRDTADDQPTGIWPHSDQHGREISQSAVDDGRDLSVTPINHTPIPSSNATATGRSDRSTGTSWTSILENRSPTKIQSARCGEPAACQRSVTGLPSLGAPPARTTDGRPTSSPPAHSRTLGVRAQVRLAGRSPSRTGGAFSTHVRQLEALGYKVTLEPAA
jgi:hypothetical protein